MPPHRWPGRLTFESRSYDSVGRLLTVNHARSQNNATVFAIAYALGPDGNRVGATEMREDGSEAEWAYDYDPLGRLVRERRDVESDGVWDRDVAYEYDGQGNRTRETQFNSAGAITQDRRYFYEPNSQRLSHIDEGGVAVESFTWTPKGEMATHTTSAGTRTFEWGEGETMEAVTLDDGTRLEYDYDDTGTLVSRRAYSAAGTLVDSESYLVDRENPTGYSQTLADLNAGTGSIRKLYTFGERLLSQEDAATATPAAPLTDGLGSIRGLTSTGQTSSINYTAFGSPLDGASSLTNSKYAFTGQVRDTASGLQYHRARWLAPERAQWQTLDPLTDFPEAFGNGFGYVGGDPVGSIDPSGGATLVETAVSNFIFSFLVSIGMNIGELARNPGKVFQQALLDGVFGALTGVFSKIFPAAMVNSFLSKGFFKVLTKSKFIVYAVKSGAIFALIMAAITTAYYILTETEIWGEFPSFLGIAFVFLISFFVNFAFGFRAHASEIVEKARANLKHLKKLFELGKVAKGNLPYRNFNEAMYDLLAARVMGTKVADEALTEFIKYVHRLNPGADQLVDVFSIFRVDVNDAVRLFGTLGADDFLDLLVEELLLTGA